MQNPTAPTFPLQRWWCLSQSAALARLSTASFSSNCASAVRMVGWIVDRRRGLLDVEVGRESREASFRETTNHVLDVRGDPHGFMNDQNSRQPLFPLGASKVCVHLVVAGWPGRDLGTRGGQIVFGCHNRHVCHRSSRAANAERGATLPQMGPWSQQIDLAAGQSETARRSAIPDAGLCRRGSASQRWRRRLVDGCSGTSSEKVCAS